MKYVYILESLDSLNISTSGLRTTCAHDWRSIMRAKCRIRRKFGPWRMSTYFAFSDEARAFAFERYLKSGSGRAFAKKHF